MSELLTEPTTSFDSLLDEFIALRKMRDDREADLKRITSRMNELEPILVEGFGERGMQSVNKHGLTLFLAVDRFVNKKSGVETEKVCEVLEEIGLGDMVSDSYSAASLKARVLEWKENEVEIPGKLNELITVGEVYRLRSRK